jgi:flavoprotein
MICPRCSHCSGWNPARYNPTRNVIVTTCPSCGYAQERQPDDAVKYDELTVKRQDLIKKINGVEA